MKISDIDKDAKLVDFENFFDVHDFEGLYLYNLNSTVYFDGVPQLKYTLKHDMFWTTLSYEIYQTPRLWWLLMKVNGVGRDQLFDSVKAGHTVKYVDKDTANRIAMQLGGVD